MPNSRRWWTCRSSRRYARTIRSHARFSKIATAISAPSSPGRSPHRASPERRTRSSGGAGAWLCWLRVPRVTARLIPASRSIPPAAASPAPAPRRPGPPRPESRSCSCSPCCWPEWCCPIWSRKRPTRSSKSSPPRFRWTPCSWANCSPCSASASWGWRSGARLQAWPSSSAGRRSLRWSRPQSAGRSSSRCSSSISRLPIS